jgi:hypothetical protein
MDSVSLSGRCNRSASCTSLQLLDSELDNNSDVFDPPLWKPGRFLQFADIALEDEASVRPVSLSAERAGNDRERERNLSYSSLVSARSDVMCDDGLMTSGSYSSHDVMCDRLMPSYSSSSLVASDVMCDRLMTSHTVDDDVVEDEEEAAFSRLKQPEQQELLTSFRDSVRMDNSDVWNSRASRSSFVVQVVVHVYF